MLLVARCGSSRNVRRASSRSRDRTEVVDRVNLTFLLERTDGKLDAVARRKEHLLGCDGSLDESPVSADDLERHAAEGEADVAGEVEGSRIAKADVRLDLTQVIRSGVDSLAVL